VIAGIRNIITVNIEPKTGTISAIPLYRGPMKKKYPANAQKTARKMYPIGDAK
jgi:hypothetical protein